MPTFLKNFRLIGIILMGLLFLSAATFWLRDNNYLASSSHQGGLTPGDNLILQGPDDTRLSGPVAEQFIALLKELKTTTRTLEDRVEPQR